MLFHKPGDMKQTQLIMGMPITILAEGDEIKEAIEKVFDFFKQIDKRFSTYKKNSEVCKFNRGEIEKKDLSQDLKKIIKLCDETKKETDGFFNPVNQEKQFDPSGVVKGWAINEAGEILRDKNIEQFYIEAGGDVQVHGKKWTVGIRNPFKNNEIVKVVEVTSEGVATSGSYERGKHIYNPKTGQAVEDIVSLTIIGPNIYEADRFATSAFAMGKQGIYFVEQIKDLEGYMIDNKGIATMTSGFARYVVKQHSE
jgi:thiamine biosynthesis lipoprotein